MSGPYQETIAGQIVLRAPPRPRHEQILARLHQSLAAAVASLASTRLLAIRQRLELSADNILHPDIALVTAASDKLWLVAEVINADDHHADTVEKKSIYEELKLPRLWIVDPRYDNVEVYHGTAYGLSLKKVLAGRNLLTEGLLPGFQFPIHELFAGNPSSEPGRFDF